MALNSETPIVYYNGPGIVVTSHHIDTGNARYRVRDLRSVQWEGAAGHAAHIVAILCGVVEIGLSGTVAVAYDSLPVACVGLLTAVATAVAVTVDERRNPRWATLEALSGGRRVVLYRSRNAREFQRVRRAVIRAVEANRRPRP
jgi:hypothetical protein